MKERVIYVVVTLLLLGIEVYIALNVNDNFIRLIPFKDHINIEAKAVVFHKDQLTEYKITPKGMMQIFHNQQIPCELLKAIFKESFE